MFFVYVKEILHARYVHRRGHACNISIETPKEGYNDTVFQHSMEELKH